MELKANTSHKNNQHQKKRWRVESPVGESAYPNKVEPINKRFPKSNHQELQDSELIDSTLYKNEITTSEDNKSSRGVVKGFNQLRTKQLIIVCLATSTVAFINNLVNQQSLITSQVLIFSVVIFGFCFVLVQKRKLKIASTILLWSIYSIITVLIASNDGLRDPAAFGYAGTLIFAAMLGRKRQFILILGCIVAVIISIGFANQYELLDFSKTPFTWGIAIDLLIVFAVIAYAVWILATDLRFALSSLEAEHLRVKKSKLAYQRIAHYDNLTGLPNRVIAVDRYNQATFHAHRDNSKVAILFIDLDNFKTVNDSLGHEVGDLLLQKIAQRLRESVREGDTVCRLGGDEFLVILDGIRENADITKVANHILANMAKSIQIAQHQMTATCSIGIAISPTDGDNFDELRKKADMAMYRAKNAGRNGLVFFDDIMNKDMLAHIDRINSLREAIVNKEFELYYQPKIDLRSGKIFSAEALIRWRRSNGELVFPDEFISIAENTGMIIEIGEWVLYEACRQCKEFQDRGMQDFSIAVNLSSIQFRRGNLESIVKGALESSSLEASYLELEVTETLLVEDSNDIRQQIESLQSIGVTFSIDDFGTGYSSLSYLRDFNFDFLKIDRAFIEKSIEKENDMILCQAIVSMAHKLKLMVVAEGLETELQMRALAAAGCEFGQGNFFSEPITVNAFYSLYELENKKHQRADDLSEFIDSLVKSN